MERPSAQNLRTYSELSDGNAREILLYLLSSGSVRGEYSDGSRLIHVKSTHPLQVGSEIYVPCEVESYYGHGGDALGRCIHFEIESLYENNPKNRDSFWKGLGFILSDLEELVTLGALGRFGLGEIFFSLGQFPQFPPVEDTHGVNQKLKSLVDQDFYRGKSAHVWPYGHPKVDPFSDKFKLGDIQVDLHSKVIIAYTWLQRSELAEYWLRMVEKDPEYANHAFRGLAFCDLEVAKQLLSNSNRLIELSIDPNIAADIVDMAERALERRLKFQG